MLLLLHFSANTWHQRGVVQHTEKQQTTSDVAGAKIRWMNTSLLRPRFSLCNGFDILCRCAWTPLPRIYFVCFHKFCLTLYIRVYKRSSRVVIVYLVQITDFVYGLVTIKALQFNFTLVLIIALETNDVDVYSDDICICFIDVF